MKDANQYIQIKYEELRGNTEMALSRLFNWLELLSNETLLSSIVELNSLDTVNRLEQPFVSIP